MRNELLTSASVFSGLGFDVAFYFYSAENAEINIPKLPGCFRVYIPGNALSSEIIRSQRHKIKEFIEISPYIDKKPSPFSKDGFQGRTLGNIGNFYTSDRQSVLCGDLSLNVYNSAAAQNYYCLSENMGNPLSSITLSPELSLAELSEVSGKICDKGDLRPEITVYGRVPVMRCEHCVVSGGFNPLSVSREASGRLNLTRRTVLKSDDLPFASHPSEKCGNCSKAGTYYLRDEKGLEYPVIPLPENCQCVILSSKVLDYTKNLINTGKNLFGKKTIMRFNIFDEEF